MEQHGQIDAADHIDLSWCEARQREIGRCAGKHVCKNDDALACIAGFDRVSDFVTALINVIFSFDGKRFKRILRTNHM